jgi:outer membrane protein assembly factor BamE (lipoprotein component of BamABCDE complex)
MTRVRFTLFMVIAGLVLSACGSLKSKEASYLDSVRGQATQAEVRQQLGEPTSTRSSETGGSVWIYERREQQPGNRYTAPGMWCEQYILTFDQQSVLRDWTRREHFHGGELMPRECVPGTGHK